MSEIQNMNDNYFDHTLIEWNSFIYDMFSSVDNKHIIVMCSLINNLKYKNIYIIIDSTVKIYPCEIINCISDTTIFFRFDVNKEYKVETGSGEQISNTYTVVPNNSQYHEFILVTKINDENKKLHDWIKYYLYHGVNCFYIYDDDVNCKNEMIENMEEFSDKYHLLKRCQTESFNHASYKFANCKYVLCCDVNEYIVCKKHDKLINMIRSIDSDDICGFKFESYCFNSEKPKINEILHMTDDFLYRLPESDKHTQKYIIKPSCFTTRGIHAPSVVKNDIIIDINTDDAQFNHYTTFSGGEDKKNKCTVYDNCILKHLCKIITVDKLSEYVKLKLNLRMKFMYLQSFSEENKHFDNNEHNESICDKVMLYPRSFVEKIYDLNNGKKYDYNFIGTLFF